MDDELDGEVERTRGGHHRCPDRHPAFAETTDPADSKPVIFRPDLDAPPGPVSIGSGRRLEVNLFTISDGVLAILVGGSIAQWNRALQLSAPVLESVVVSLTDPR